MNPNQRGNQATAWLPGRERSVSGKLVMQGLDSRIDRALVVLGEQYNKPNLTFTELAKSLNLSWSGFRHLFTKTVGMPPYKYLRVLHLEHGCELLRSSFLSVKETASAVGYPEASRFSKEFRARYHVSPREYRKRSAVIRAISATAAHK
jgi:AraC-like DNA-binding protein